jgi:uncharacterized protein (TIGR02145 family)
MGNSSLGTATLKVMPGIPDRMFGQLDENNDTGTHKFVYLSVKNPTTGKTWLNNNLGADYADTTNLNSFNPTQQAKASNDYHAYGSLFQWGRKADGHELITWESGTNGTVKYGTTTTKSNTPSTDFIKSEKDWRSDSDPTLWEDKNTVNNVCPVGYRLPTSGYSTETEEEWEKEVKSWSGTNPSLENTLRLTKSGHRATDGVLKVSGDGYYWSAIAVGGSKNYLATSYYLKFYPDPKDTNKTKYLYSATPRSKGYAVRCIKD